MKNIDVRISFAVNELAHGMVDIILYPLSVFIKVKMAIALSVRFIIIAC